MVKRFYHDRGYSAQLDNYGEHDWLSARQRVRNVLSWLITNHGTV